MKGGAVELGSVLFLTIFDKNRSGGFCYAKLLSASDCGVSNFIQMQDVDVIWGFSRISRSGLDHSARQVRVPETFTEIMKTGFSLFLVFFSLTGWRCYSPTNNTSKTGMELLKYS